VGVIKGELDYPPVDEMKDAVKGILRSACFIDATDRALSLGNPILANIVILGALGRLAVVPFDRDDFKEAIALRLAPGQAAINLQAFDEVMDGSGLSRAVLTTTGIHYTSNPIKVMDKGRCGLEIYGRILEIRPQPKAIIVSGFRPKNPTGSEQLRNSERVNT